MASSISITSSTPAPNPQCLADMELQFRHSEGPIGDGVLLSAGLAVANETEAFQGQSGHFPWQGWDSSAFQLKEKNWLEDHDRSTVEVIPTRDLPSWLRASLPRLLRLCDMQPDWDSYGSPPPSFALVKDIAGWLRLAEKETLPEPEVVPTSSGGIQLEWYLGKRELEIEFTTNGQLEYLRSDNERREEEEDIIKDLDDLRSLLEWLIG